MGTFSIWHWLVVSALLYAPYAIGNYFIADRMGRNRVVWVILSLIPLINLFFGIYVIVSLIVYVLDSLKEIGSRAAPEV